MSGIYIPGMDMPTSCFQCKLLDYTDTYKCRVRFESLAKEHGINISRPDWCPLVPVPEHGRLLKVLKTERECVSRDCDRNCGKCDLSMEGSEILSAYDALIAVLAAPAIIPADKEADNE